MQTTEKIYQLALHLVKGIGFRNWHKLIQQIGSAQAIFDVTKTNLPLGLKKLPSNLLNPIIQKTTLPIAEKILENHTKNNIQVISFFEKSYPERLKHITNPPAFLYYKGNAPLNLPRIVSIIGTRQATPYGKKAVEYLIEGLTDYDTLIVSGLAYGIDVHAHSVALEKGLPTIAVLASGLDTIYPMVHEKIANSMVEQGGLLSEIPIGNKAENFQFILRNRIIAGISDATIVIEAGRKSGALTTAYLANDYNRTVFAIPGSINELSSLGCNHLIKTQQAHLLSDSQDIAYIMNWGKKLSIHNPTKEYATPIKLTEEENSLLRVLRKSKKEVAIDELCNHTDYSATNLSSIILQLHLKNIVEILPGNQLKVAGF
jgi:DNA processing protein